MGSKLKPAGQLHYLRSRQVVAAKAGKHSDGAGLVLVVGEDGSARWAFRYTSPSGVRREAGLGIVMRDSVAAAGASLTAARDAAHEARQLLRRGLDPLEERDASRQAKRKADEEKKAAKARERWTLARCARDFHARVIERTRTPKHAAQWISSLENHMPASVWHAPIDSITPPQLLDALLAIEPHEQARNLTDDHRIDETRSRVRQRLDAVFEDAAFYGRVKGNPARAILRKLREQMGERKRGNLRSLDYRLMPQFMAKLREAQGVAARCLELLTLTAARTSEALLAEWAEVDLDARTWTVPGEKMKAGEAHTVYLSEQAVRVIEGQRGLDERYIFPSVTLAGAPLSNMALLATLDRLGEREHTTTHGLRASFSTWAYDGGHARGDVIEACLAHKEQDRIKRAYSRATFTAERAALLAKWADYCDGEIIETPQAQPRAAVYHLPVAA